MVSPLNVTYITQNLNYKSENKNWGGGNKAAGNCELGTGTNANTFYRYLICGEKEVFPGTGEHLLQRRRDLFPRRRAFTREQLSTPGRWRWRCYFLAPLRALPGTNSSPFLEGGPAGGPRLVHTIDTSLFRCLKKPRLNETNRSTKK